MKKGLFVFFCFLFGQVAQSQPAIDSRYHATLGNTFTMFNFRDSVVALPTTGHSQHWEIRNVGRLTDSLETLPADSGIGHSLYPGCDILLRSNQHSEYYLANRPDGLRYGGVWRSSTQFIYTPLLTFLHIPLAFGDSIVDTVTSTYYDRLIYHNRYVGHGTATIAGTTYPDVALMKMHAEVFRYDSLSGSYEYDYSINDYIMYAPGFGFPILDMNIDNAMPTGFYLVGNPITSLLHSPAQRLSAWPSPALDQVRIRIPDNAFPATARLIDMAGREVYSHVLSSETMPLQGIKPGLYTLLIQGRQRTYRTRLVKE